VSRPALALSRVRRLERRSLRALRRVLECDPGIRLQLVPPSCGRGGRTLLVQSEGRTLAILRAFSQRSRILRLREATRKLQFLGVPSPRLLWSDASLTGRLWRGAYLTLEEFLGGVPLGQVSERAPALDRLAGSLARLHSDHRASWGTFGRRKRRGYAHARLRQARLLLRRLLVLQGIPRSEARELAAALSAWKPRLQALRVFHLLHNDISFGNVLVGADGYVTLVDLYRMRYDRRERELSMVAGRLLEMDPSGVSRFLAAYERQGGKGPEPDLWAFETFLVSLERWARMLEYSRAGSPSQQAWAAERAARWRARARAHFESLQPPGAAGS